MSERNIHALEIRYAQTSFQIKNHIYLERRIPPRYVSNKGHIHSTTLLKIQEELAPIDETQIDIEQEELPQEANFCIPSWQPAAAVKSLPITSSTQTVEEPVQKISESIQTVNSIAKHRNSNRDENDKKLLELAELIARKYTQEQPLIRNFKERERISRRTNTKTLDLSPPRLQSQLHPEHDNNSPKNCYSSGSISSERIRKKSKASFSVEDLIKKRPIRPLSAQEKKQTRSISPKAMNALWRGMQSTQRSYEITSDLQKSHKMAINNELAKSNMLSLSSGDGLRDLLRKVSLFYNYLLQNPIKFQSRQMKHI